MKYDHNEIKKIAENFLNNGIKDEIPNGLGFSICFPLSILLSILKIDHKIAIGYATINKMSTSHFWIKFEMDDFILDPTIRQFDPSNDPIYVGKILDHKTTREYIELNVSWDQEFPVIYKIWSAPLYQKMYMIPRSKSFEDKMNATNIKIATGFIACIREYGIEDQIFNNVYSKLYKIY